MRLKNDFCNRITYLDNAATTLKPKCVVDSYISTMFKNVDVELHRGKIASFLNVSKEQVKFTRGTTHSLNLVAKYLKNSISKISVPIFSHHSNLLPWKVNFDVEYIKELKDEYEYISMDHVSNVLGNINRIPKGKILVIDGAQAPANFKVDLSKIDCNFYAFSGHKIYGPTGIGILYDRDNVIEENYFNYAAIESLSVAIEYFNDNYIDQKKLYNILVEQLKELNAKIYSVGHVPIATFNIPGIHPHDVASLLSESVAIRAGNHCAQLLAKALGGATLRASLGIYNDEEDIDIFIRELKKAIKFFK